MKERGNYKPAIRERHRKRLVLKCHNIYHRVEEAETIEQPRNRWADPCCEHAAAWIPPFAASIIRACPEIVSKS